MTSFSIDSQKQPINPDDVTIAVILALPHETAGARVIFSDLEDLDNRPGNQYGFTGYLCRIPSYYDGTSSRSIVLAEPTHTGNNHTAICVSQLHQAYKNLEYVILCGIAGGVPTRGNSERDVYLGDIVVANSEGILQHDFGHDVCRPKVKYLLDKSRNAIAPSNVFLTINNSIRVDVEHGCSPWIKRLDERLSLLVEMNSDYNRPSNAADLYAYDQTYWKWKWKWKRKIQRIPKYDAPKVFYGRIASGNCLLKNPFRRDKLRDEYRILAVEMEAAGLAAACDQARLNFTVVRGICDYCDSNKNDRWQRYAAAAAASYAYCIVERIQDKPPRIHMVDGSISPDLSPLERINVKAAMPDSPSTSSETGLEDILKSNRPSKEDVDTGLFKKDFSDTQESNVALKLHQNIQKMEQFIAHHDVESLIKLAEDTECMLQNAKCIINEDLHAEGLYQISRAYIAHANLLDGEKKRDKIDHVKQLIEKAKRLVE